MQKMFYFRMTLTILLLTVSFSFGKVKNKFENQPDYTDQNVTRIPADKVEIVPGKIVVKFKTQPPAYAKQNSGKPSVGFPTVDAIANKFDIKTVKKIFPEKTQTVAGKVDLSRFYKFKFDQSADVYQIIQELQSDPMVEYAEPQYVSYAYFTPNDARYDEQLHLLQIKADSAWDIHQGSKDVIIGVVDTGVDYLHEDLAANIWVNPGEDLNGNGVVDESDMNGIDDDGNGKVDDIRGWDFVDLENTADVAAGEDALDEDNDPMDFDGHGTHVSGTAAAVTNNGIGVAGVAYQLTIMPLRVGYHTTDDNALMDDPYRAIVYAADNGANVVNLSWGGGGYSSYAQEIINYAYEKGVVIIGSAGNDGNYTVHYPSAYDNVVSVAATLHDIDLKAGYSTYHESVDISAPGSFILATTPGNNYEYKSGTSMAAPVVSGVAGLVKSAHMDWDNDRIIRQLIETTDDIYDRNPDYRGYLGSGRVNAYRALTETPSSVRVFDWDFDDSITGDNNGRVDNGETIAFSISVKSYLDNVTNVTATLSTEDEYITLLNDSFDFGNINQSEGASNDANPFMFSTDPETPLGHRVSFRIDISANDGSYNSFKYINTYVRPLFADHDINNVRFTVTSFGIFGFNDYANSGQYLGNGFQYPIGTTSTLYHGSLWVGTSANQVSDCSENYADGDRYDFVTSEGGSILFDNKISDQDGYARFNDSSALNPIGLEITQKSYAWVSVPDSDYVVVEYTLHNTTDQQIEDIYTGLFIDWDIDSEPENLNDVGWDAENNLGYMYGDSTKYYGIAMLYPAATGYTGLDHNDGLNDARKFELMSNGFGMTATPFQDDWSHVVSTGPVTLAPGERTVVTFAVLGGDDLGDIKQNSAAAAVKYAPMAPANIDIDHTPLVDTEDNANPYTVQVQLAANENAIDPGSVSLFWKTDGAGAFNQVQMTTTDDINFSGDIPAQNETEVSYYVQAQSVSGLYSKLPFEAPAEVFSFYVGLDNKAPVISDITKLDNTLNLSGPFTVSATVVDNMGLKENGVYLFYQVNAGAADSTLMAYDNGTKQFLADISFETVLSPNDSISYYISALDKAAQPNKTVSEVKSFKVVNTLAIDGFEGDLNQWDLGSGWAVYFYANTGAFSITDSPDGYYSPNSENTLTLLNPFNLVTRETALLSFYYIHSLNAGDSCFVEASKDGLTWDIIGAYTGESGYTYQQAQLSINDFCGAGAEQVQIRFRLVADEDNNVADGFYIDDIEVLADPGNAVENNHTENSLPTVYKLGQNYPNPFNPSTTINYELPKAGHVNIEIFSILGERINVLVDKHHNAGRYQQVWNGRNSRGVPVSTGVYFYRIKSNSFTDVKKMILLK